MSALVSTLTGNSGATAVASQAVTGPGNGATFAALIVNRGSGQGTNALTGVTDTAGNTWTLATRGAVGGGANTRTELWFCSAYSQATTVTFAGPASVSSWTMLGFTGLAGDLQV